MYANRSSLACIQTHCTLHTHNSPLNHKIYFTWHSMRCVLNSWVHDFKHRFFRCWLLNICLQKKEKKKRHTDPTRAAETWTRTCRHCYCFSALCITYFAAAAAVAAVVVVNEIYILCKYKSFLATNKWKIFEYICFFTVKRSVFSLCAWRAGFD